MRFVHTNYSGTSGVLSSRGRAPLLLPQPGGQENSGTNLERPGVQCGRNSGQHRVRFRHAQSHGKLSISLIIIVMVIDEHITYGSKKLRGWRLENT